jgi:hypothetical protein
VKTVLTLSACAVALAVSVSASGRSTLVSCRGSQLQGTFAVVQGSAGAGNITYALRLRNSSKTTCQLTGLPQGRLLGRRGAKLPTLVRAAFPGALAAVLVTLSPGQATRATARFSPDVPGPGEGTKGRCEPTAYTFRVTGQGGGTTAAKVVPPTSVCEHGRLLFSAYGRP